jgi:hypothetical protein
MYVQDRSQFGSVNMKTGLWAEQPRNKELILDRDKRFSSSLFRQALRPTKSPIQWVSETLPENKQAEA